MIKVHDLIKYHSFSRVIVLTCKLSKPAQTRKMLIYE